MLVGLVSSHDLANGHHLFRRDRGALGHRNHPTTEGALMTSRSSCASAGGPRLAAASSETCEGQEPERDAGAEGCDHAEPERAICCQHRRGALRTKA